MKFLDDADGRGTIRKTILYGLYNVLKNVYICDYLCVCSGAN